MSKAIPRTIIGAFVLFCAGALYMVYLSTQHPSELVHEQYYAESMQHDARMTAQSNAMTDKATCWISAEHSGTMLFTSDNPSWEQLKVSFVRPSNASLDQDVVVESSNDTVTVDISSLQAGMWSVRVSWQTEKGEFHHEQSLMVQR